MCRETVSEIGSGDWKGLLADIKDVDGTISWSEVDDRSLNRDGTSAD